MTIAERIEVLNQAAGIVAKFREITDKANPVAVAEAIRELGIRMSGSGKAKTTTRGGLTDAILDELASGPKTAPEVARLIGRPLPNVGGTLSVLAKHGRLVHDNGTPRKYSVPGTVP